MNKQITFAAFCLFSLFPFFANAQIINIEKARKVTDTVGLAGGAQLRGSYFENEQRYFNISAIPDVQYKTKKDLILLIGAYSLSKTEDIELQNAGMVHLRYNRKMNDVIRFEAFQQIQKDAVNKIDYRYLVGAGLRTKLIESDFTKIYLGVLPMLELEQSDPPVSRFQRDVRASNYLSFSFFMNDTATLYSTSYYQPDVSELADYRFYNENQLSFALGETTSFDLTSRFTFDSEPPIDAPNRFVLVSGGFSVYSR